MQGVAEKVIFVTEGDPLALACWGRGILIAAQVIKADELAWWDAQANICIILVWRHGFLRTRNKAYSHFWEQ